MGMVRFFHTLLGELELTGLKIGAPCVIVSGRIRRLLEWREHMTPQRKLYLVALGFLLGATSNLLADGPTFTPIDFPGAASTTPWGMNTRGDIVGLYVNADKSTHGFLLSGGQFSSFDFLNAAATAGNAINQGGDIVGRYTIDGVTHGYLLVGLRPACVAGN
jgi:hypothetical protein